MSLTSTELNYLVWRYLQEAGHELAAYALDRHSSCADYEKNVPVLSKLEPGYLVNLVQKGILYSLTEEELRADSQKSEILTFLGSLMKEKKDVESYEAMQNGRTEAPENKTQENQHQYVTKTTKPAINYEESLLSKWHPLAEVFACIKGDATVAISAIKNDRIIESAALEHPGGSINNKITALAWSPVGNSIVTADDAGNLCSWSPDGSLRNTTNIHISTKDSSALKPIGEILWNDSGLYFFTVDLNNNILLWDGASLNLIHQVCKGLKDVVLGVTWIDDLKFAVSTGPKSITVSSISVSTKSAFADAAAPTLTVVPATTLRGHEGVASHLLFDKTSRYLASYSPSDKLIKLWASSSTSEPKVMQDSSPSKIQPFVLLSWLSEASLVSVSIDGAIRVWSQDKVAVLNSFDKANYHYDAEHQESTGSFIYSAALSADRRWLSLGDDTGRVTIWDVEQPLKCVLVFDQLAPDGTILSADSDAGICDISWDFQSKKVCVSYKGADSVVINCSV